MLVDCDIALARYPFSLYPFCALSANAAVSHLSSNPHRPRPFRLFAPAFTHSIPHAGIQKPSAA